MRHIAPRTVAPRTVAPRPTLAFLALTAFALGVLVYIATRNGELAATALLGLPALPWISIGLPVPAAGSLPSLLHALTFTLLSTLAFRTQRALAAVVLSWLAIEFAFEFAQLTPLVNGTFDPLDLVAAATGCALAGILARFLR